MQDKNTSLFTPLTVGALISLAGFAMIDWIFIARCQRSYCEFFSGLYLALIIAGFVTTLVGLSMLQLTHRLARRARVAAFILMIVSHFVIIAFTAFSYAIFTPGAFMGFAALYAFSVYRRMAVVSQELADREAVPIIASALLYSVMMFVTTYTIITYARLM